MGHKNIRFRILDHTDQKTIDEMYNDYSPIFILSTGRSGSKFLVTLLNCSENVTAYHEPRPTLQYFSNYAFHHQEEEKVLANSIDAARMELILEVFIKNRIYVESNQCLTFFAPMIAALFKKSKFVHLTRHPGDFVRSAVRKGWHKNDSIWESGRVKMADKDRWAHMDQIERLSWLWMTTNRFIDGFKEQLQAHRYLTVKLEDLVEKKNEVRKLLEYTGAAGIETGKIKEMQAKRINEFYIQPDEPPNMKKMIDFPPYKEWNEGKKNKLKTILEDMALRCGYAL